MVSNITRPPEDITGGGQMYNLNSSNYYSLEANKHYWSVSLFKQFDKCEAAGFASVRGVYEREQTDALLIGSYVDAY